jgi:hypothetical protein
MDAGWYGHADCARLLLDAGADTEAKDKVRASAGWWRALALESKFCFFDVACGRLWRVMPVLAGCDARKRAICTFVFSVCFGYVRVVDSGTLNAPNRGAASKVCGN